MEKITKEKRRTYTITYAPSAVDTPCIKITGKWLKELGFEIGQKLELLQTKNMIILIKK